MGEARLDRLPVCHRQRFCRRRLAALRRSRRRRRRGLDAAVYADLAVAIRSSRVRKPVRASGCRRDRCVYADRTCRSSYRCRSVTAARGSRPDAVDPVDGARRCNDGATDRAVEDWYQGAQGWPGTDVARDGKDSRSQGVRAKPAAAANTAAPSGCDSASAKTASGALRRADHSGASATDTSGAASSPTPARAGTASDHAAGR